MAAEGRLLILRKKQKEATKLNATKELAKAQNFLDSDTELKQDLVEVTINKLKSYQAKINEFDDQILPELDDDEINSEVEKSMELGDKILEATELLQSRLKIANNIQSNDTSHNISNVSSTSVRSQSHTIKLPKLEMAKFSGDVLKWQEFWDSFSNIVHNNDDLSPIDKFGYLKSFLSGDAKRIADGYSLTAANYETVVDSLTQRFGNPQVVIFSHFETLLALPVANHDLSQLQAVFDNCEKHIRSLVALGLPESTFGQVFVPIVLSKLPKFVRMELHRRNGSTAWTLSRLRELLREEIYARDMCERNFTSTNPQNPVSETTSSSRKQDLKKNQSKTHSPATSSSLVSSSEKKPSCEYCGQSHYSDQCSKFPDVNSRRSQLNGRCLSCLVEGHMVRECQTRVPCYYCKRPGHHQSLCERKFGPRLQKSQDVSLNVDSSEVEAPEFIPVNSTTSLLSHGEKTILQTAITNASGGRNTVSARLLLDTGCTRSFLTTRLCEAIGAEIKGEETISIAGFSDSKRKSVTYKICEFNICLKNGEKKRITANATDVITCPVQKFPVDVKSHPFISLLPLAEPLITEPKMIQIDILIGGDYYYDFVDAEQIKCSDGLVLLSSPLGYITAGRLPSDDSSNLNAISMLLTKGNCMPDTNFDLEKFWKLEDVGVHDAQDPEDDEVALNYFNRTIRFEDGRYEVKWPWKNNCPGLSDNYGLSRGRLKSLLKRLAPMKEVQQKYDKTINDQLEKGIIEEAPAVPDGDKVYYMPHHCVITPQKTTTKLRVVYDASSKANSKDVSLNDCIYRGPVMLSDLCGLIIRFRLPKIAIVSDIEKAFLQVGLQKSDRDVTRFLWVKDCLAPLSEENLIVYRFRRVPFGVNASPFLLAGTVDHHLTTVSTPVAVDIQKNIYVDNVFGGRQSTDEAVDYYKEAKSIFVSASMNLREWYSNDDSFMSQVPDADRGSGSSTKVLGISWNLSSDTLTCSMKKFADDSMNTKRQFLKALASVFDPCGFFAPITISGKILLEEIWRDKYDWDTPLPDELNEAVHKVLTNLSQISETAINRRYSSDVSSPESSCELHCFCDASEKAYCAVVYLRVKTSTKVTTDLVFAKSRVSPLKELSIPKLELMAAVVGVRLLSFVESQLRISIQRKFLWSDSKCVLHWIKGKEVATVFVRNRIREIKNCSGVDFLYVQTSQNPADLPSRGLDSQRLSDLSTWWHGPTFLENYQDDWDTDFTETSSIKDSDTDIVDDLLVAAERSNVVCPIHINRFSSLRKLLRVTAFVFRFLAASRKCRSDSRHLSADEIYNARIFWEKQVQSSELADIFGDKTSSSLVQQLGLFKGSDGMIRCRGRYQNADISIEAKCPLLLPRSHPLTRLVILDCHIDVAHDGIQHTLSQVRLRYWIPGGRSEVRKVLRGCYTCIRTAGGPFRIPDAPDLPDFRITRSHPFSRTGLDYLGPLYIRSSDSTYSKVWLCLFTCAVTRAVHLEVVSDLSAKEFSLCFRRFTALYRMPDLVVSDNAKHFHLTNKSMQKLWHHICNSDDIQNFSAYHGIKWKFITELAPWMGGFYERMVGIVKTALKKTLDRKRINVSELQTIIAEISASVNSRPLVYQSDEVGEGSLTPAHFLLRLGSQFPHVPNNEPDFISDCSAQSLIIQWKRIQALLDSFWQKWQNDYLLNLRERWRQQKQRGAECIIPAVGNTVLIKDSLPRGQWRLGIITSLIPSVDRACRSVVLRVANGRTIKRPIKLLYPIETTIDFRSKDSQTDDSSVQQPSINGSFRRPRRAAAQTALSRIKTHLKDNDCEEAYEI